MRRPIRVKGRRFVGNFDVFDQGRDDLVTPALIDKFRGPRDIDHLKTPGVRRAAAPGGSGPTEVDALLSRPYHFAAPPRRQMHRRATVMAKIVLGIATSHTPMLNTPAKDWPSFIDRDGVREFLDKEGDPASYEELLTRADPRALPELTPERFAARHDDAMA